MRRTTRLALALLALAVPGSSGDGGPIALVLTYTCAPQNRPALREHLEGAGGLQLAEWRRQKKFAESLLLFGLDANDDLWDALLLLRFESWAQYWAWKEVERGFPAGLGKDALGLTSRVTSTLSELAWQGSAPSEKRPNGRPVYFVRPYYFDDPNLYRKFFEAYNKPQFQLWLRDGALNRYWGLMNQHPTGGTWGVTLIYEYPGWEAATGRDAVKDAAAPELRGDPAWDVLGQVKSGIRKSGRVTLAEALQQITHP